MKLVFLTKSQEKQIFDKRYNYDRNDVLELSCLSGSISALAHCMQVYYLARDEKEEGIDESIFYILEKLIEPINTFLTEGAPKQKEEEK